MQDILRHHPEDSRRGRAWAFGISLSAYISILMILGTGSGDSDTSMLLSMDPMLILLAQGLAALFMFVIVPWIVIGVGLQLSIKEFFPKVSLSTVGLTILVSISFMVVNSAVGEWNMNLDFGDSDFAQWARKSEDQLKEVTEYLLDFKSGNQFFWTFIVIAIIPAVGEELLFRGLIQNMFSRAFKNPHIAIWLTGILFAAIHMQFFGFVPRMLLGVVFGYLYLWSGKLTVAMIGHLVNNGLALIAVYFAQQGTLEVTPEQMEQSAPWPVVLLFAILCFVLLRQFYRNFKYA